MSYLDSPFLHDVFVSYAHGRGDRLKNWSQCLADELRSDIVDWVDGFDEIDIFIDEQLDPTRPLTAQLRQTVGACGLLLVIMSRRYLQSAWCRDEIDWFEDEVRQRGVDGGLVLVVRAQPTEQSDWPACLKDERGEVVPGFQFHPDSKPGIELVHPYGWPEPQSSDRRYFEALEKLTNAVVTRLQEMRARELERMRASQPRGRIPVEGMPHIYLQAPVTERAAWRVAKRELEGVGCVVLPSELPQVDNSLKAVEEARRQRQRTLLTKAHGLCFLRTYEGHGVDREVDTLVTDRSALRAAGRELPCAVLDRAGGDSTRLSKLGVEVIDATRGDWLHRFQGWLRRALGMETSQ